MSINIDHRIFPNKQEIGDWQQKLNSFGPRFTGNLAHQNLINYFQLELEKLGLEVHRDQHTFKKWEAKSWGLSVLQENGGFEEIPVTFYYPYSGETPQIPKERRGRSIVFVFVTGHFQIPQFGIKGQATTRWLKDHPELWNGEGTNKKAVAGITIEHLGCTEWKDDDQHANYTFTHEIDNELVFTANQAMDRIYLNAVQGRTKVRTITLKPKGKFYFGEGQPLYEANIPTISLVPGPDNLCAVGDNGHMEKIDVDLMYEQIETFTKVVTAIDHVKTEELGMVEPSSFSLLGLFVKGE